MGHSNFFYLKRLPEFVEGMKKRDSKIKSKKQPVTKNCITRAKKILDIVHTYVLEKISPEVVDGHCYVNRFVDSFSRFSKVYYATRDELCADVGKPGTLVSDGSGE